MDTESLVESKIEEGRRFIDELVRNDFEVLVAFWANSSEGGPWRLFIASPSFRPEKIGEAYSKVFASIKGIAGDSIQPTDLKLIPGTSPVAVSAVEIRDRSPGKGLIRYRGEHLGGLSIAEALIYPPPGKWFRGFDEIKRNFPSAEAFTIPILFKDIGLLHSLEGTLNATEFEGRGPGTVMFVGPKASSGKPLAELFFVHRPEGWNTLYRADTGRYEEVRDIQTGEPIYQSTDFRPLAALKTDQKRGDDAIERISWLLDQGYRVTISLDERPLGTISKTEPLQPIEWDAIRTHLQRGGTVNISFQPKKEAGSNIPA